MKYFVGTVVGKKDFNRVGKCTRDCTGRCSFDFFLILFFHSCCECYTRALAAHNAFFFSPWKECFRFAMAGDGSAVCSCFCGHLQKLLCVDTDSLFDFSDILVHYIWREVNYSFILTFKQVFVVPELLKSLKLFGRIGEACVLPLCNCCTRIWVKWVNLLSWIGIV